MGRVERRKQQKHMSKKLTPEQFNSLQSGINQDFINIEVEKRCDFFKTLFSESLKQAFKNHGISNSKAKVILDDVEAIIIRKVNKVE